MRCFLPVIFAMALLSSGAALANTPDTVLPAWQPAAPQGQIALWPDAVPNAVKNAKAEVTRTNLAESIGGKHVVAVTNVTRPTLTVYPPKGENTGVAVIVFPGGGYKILAMDLEGTEVCDWLTAKGMTCILLKYRVPNSGPYWDNGCKCHIYPKPQTALQDARRALGLARRNARAWSVDPHKIGVLGFSAGGHLVAATSTNFGKRSYKPVDDADEQSCRPDFAIALYPGHLTVDGDDTKLPDDIPVTGKTSPTFLLQAEDDHVDGDKNVLVYYQALEKAHVPAEMHLYAEGGHAFGLRPSKFPISKWPQLVENWLVTIGMLEK